MYAGLTNNELAIRKLADFVEVFKEELTLLDAYDSAKSLQWETGLLPELITANTLGLQVFVDINDFETLLLLVGGMFEKRENRDLVAEETKKTLLRKLYTGTTTERRNRLWRNIKFFLSVAKDIAAAEGPPQINDASST